MSRLAYFGSVTLSLSPATESESPFYALFPETGEPSESAVSAPFTLFPVIALYDVFHTLKWRIRRILPSINIEFLGIPAFAGNGEIDYFVETPATELDLMKPDYYRYSGSVVSGGNSFNVTMEFLGPFDLAYYWRTDTGTPLMIPRLIIEGGFSIADGGEASGLFGTGPRPDPVDRTTFYFETTITFFGETISMWVNPDTEMVAWSVDFSGLQWWEYRENGTGFNPIWDADTGDQLLSILPIYEGNTPV